MKLIEKLEEKLICNEIEIIEIEKENENILKQIELIKGRDMSNTAKYPTIITYQLKERTK